MQRTSRAPAPPLPASPETLLTTGDTARLLRVHPKQVYRLLKRGLPGRRVGDQWRFERERVLAWARGGEAAPSASVPVHPAAPPLLASNGDAAVECLLQEMKASGPHVLGGLVADRDEGIALFRARRVLAAGFHGGESPVRFPEGRVARIHLVRREVGLVGRGPRGPTLAEAAKARLASRPPSAGCRTLLDDALRGARIDPARVHRRAKVCASHREVCCAVASGECDVGVSTRAWAGRLGLAFTPIVTEDYSVLVFAEDLGRPEIVRLLELAQDPVIRRRIEAEAGYDASGAGIAHLVP